MNKYKDLRIHLMLVALLLVVLPSFAKEVQTAKGISVTQSVSQPLTQIQAFNCDFDDNIFVTPAEIKVWDSVNKKEVGVSTAEWALVRDKLGKEGPWKHFVVRAESLREFGDTGAEGVTEFKHQIEKALANPKKNWKGPSWKAFVEALSKPGTRTHTTLITARLHSPEAILAGLQVLKERGLILALPEKENIFSVGWPGLPEKFQGKDTSESKAKVMLYLLDQVEAVPVPKDAGLVENQAGTGKAKLHLWGFSDDDFGNYSKALDVLSKEVAKGRWPHVKISLFYTGLNNPKEKPRSVILTPEGKPRSSLPVEATRMGDIKS